MGSVMDWSKLPDLAAIALLTSAFASVARKRHTHQTNVWLLAWLMIGFHFGALVFAGMPGLSGQILGFLGLAALAWAGVLFMWASVPHYKQRSSRWMLIALLSANGIYLGVLSLDPKPGILVGAANLYWILPAIVTLIALPEFHHWLRWLVVGLNAALSAFLLIFETRPDGADLALNAILFAVYLGCCVHFMHAFRKGTGAFITVAGFVAWAAVFIVAPALETFRPGVHVQSEIWNLPKYVVAIGMILLFLEDQIAQNKYLALHDELTGLPNRRLFQDRFRMVLERSTRSGRPAALLLVDLDHFKDVNDRFGHHVGDLLLQAVGQLLTTRLRRSDTVARTGGDEFSIILADTERDAAFSVKNILEELLKQPLKIAGHTISAAASIGFAVYPDNGSGADALCIAADRSMYSAKRASRKGSPIEASAATIDTRER